MQKIIINRRKIVLSLRKTDQINLSYRCEVRCSEISSIYIDKLVI